MKQSSNYILVPQLYQTPVGPTSDVSVDKGIPGSQASFLHGSRKKRKLAILSRYVAIQM